jgi:hypothetical protein
VLLAIARALQLDEDATAYLLQLASPPSPRSKRTRKPEKVSDSIRTLISSWPLTPAYVHGRYMDILAANTLATALCSFLTPGRNTILDAFTEPEMRELRPDWDAMTARAVPHLRSIAGPDTGDPRLVELVGELSLRSERFPHAMGPPGRQAQDHGHQPVQPPAGRAASAQLRTAAHHGQRHAGPGHLPRPARQRLRRTPAPARQHHPPTPAPAPLYRHDQPARTRPPRTTSQRDGIPGRISRLA